MIQKTYHIHEYTEAKFNSVLDEIAAMPEYESSSQILLIMLEQGWDKTVINRKISMVRAGLPKVQIVGATHFDNMLVLGGTAPNNTILTFMFFENPAVEIGRFELSGITEDEAGRELGQMLSRDDTPKCLMTLISGKPLDVERMLEAAEEGNPDIPVFGAAAGLDTLILHEGAVSYVIDDDGVHENSLLAVLFCGKNLHIRASYNFGWTEVGRIMTITGLKDPYTVTEIDGMTAADIFEKYLGIPWRRLDMATENICEFPLSVSRDVRGEEKTERHMARIPYSWTDDGSLHFAVAMHEGEEIRFTYGLPQNIFEQVKDDSGSFMSFVPQAMLMVICMNRMIFLRDAEHIETDYYRNLVPEAAFMHGNSEIFRSGGAGGEMHSALIAVGFREGSDMTGARSLIKLPFDENNMARDTVIPLDLRLMSFMKAVTGDLERATEELMQLKNNLEDEVEKKTRENEGLSLHVVQTLADAIDAKDTYTNGHSGRVADYSREIARRYGYSEKAQNEIYMMGLLHDVGKIGVPDAVINKPGKLTDEEFAEMKKHPVMGAKILGNIEERPELVTGARWHHERWDGRGYPDGISGMDIPEQARIIAVADAYDAMTSNRSYRGAMEQSKVRGQIEGGRGSQFDERFADIMLQMMDEDTEYNMREK
jgi:response regulator RpfG family c-di-GMP phosphodiesterase